METPSPLPLAYKATPSTGYGSSNNHKRSHGGLGSSGTVSTHHSPYDEMMRKEPIEEKVEIPTVDTLGFLRSSHYAEGFY